ncbi:MAG: DUF1570 domain-containing protein [Planctomycetota bacterium]
MSTAPRVNRRLGRLARGAAALCVATLLAAPALADTAPADEPPADEPQVKPGPWNKRDIPAGWLVGETEHYHVQCQAGPEKLKMLSDHLESMWAVYAEFLPSRRTPPTFVLKIFRDREAYLGYGAPKTSAAYYDQITKELVGYDTGVILGVRDIGPIVEVAQDVLLQLPQRESQRLVQLLDQVTDAYTMDTARILSHEGWHQYFHMYTVSWVDMPSWLDEGVGDYFFMATLDEQQTTAKHGYRLGDLNDIRLRTLQRALVDGSTVDFQTLLGFAQKDYYRNASVYYAQGWSMVQFLMHHESNRYRELIPKLIKDFKDTKNFKKSTDKVFKGLDMDSLDREWVGWVLKTKAPDPLRDLAAEFGDRLRTEHLRAPESVLRAYDWHLEHRTVPAKPAGP